MLDYNNNNNKKSRILFSDQLPTESLQSREEKTTAYILIYTIRENSPSGSTCCTNYQRLLQNEFKIKTAELTCIDPTVMELRVASSPALRRDTLALTPQSSHLGPHSHYHRNCIVHAGPSG